jgi:hypothetical protein
MRMVSVVVILVLLVCPTVAGTAAAETGGTPVHVCGRMTEYRAPTTTQPGAITVAGEQFAISSDARQNVTSDATVGSDVCLAGKWFPSQTVGRNLTELTVAPRVATPEAAADRLAAALTASDFTTLETLISPSGFDWARAGSGGLPTKTPQEAVAFLRAESGGRLDVTAQPRPIYSNTVGPFPGTHYITSTWRNFGNLPTQPVNLVLNAVNGGWYWSGALTNAAPPGACASSAGPGIAPPTSVPSGLPGFRAAWYGQSGYMTLCPGESMTATVAMYNSGSIGWLRGVLGQVAYLGTWNPSPGQDQPSVFGGDGTSGSPSTGWPRYNRVAIQPTDYVGPNQIAWFQFSVRAPTTPGTYTFYIRPLIEGAQWMEDYGIYWQITVPQPG